LKIETFLISPVFINSVNQTKPIESKILIHSFLNVLFFFLFEVSFSLFPLADHSTSDDGPKATTDKGQPRWPQARLTLAKSGVVEPRQRPMRVGLAGLRWVTLIRISQGETSPEASEANPC